MATNNDEKFDKAYTACLVKITKEGLWEMPTKLIGRASYGSIAEVCKKGGTDCNYVMKIMSTGEAV